MLSVDGFSSERPDSGGAGNKKTADENENESESGGKSPSRMKWSGKAVAGGLLLMPRGAIQ